MERKKEEESYRIEDSELDYVLPNYIQVVMPNKIISLIQSDMLDLRKISIISLNDFRSYCIIKKQEKLFKIAEELLIKSYAISFNGIPTKHQLRSLKHQNIAAYCILLDQAIVRLVNEYCEDMWEIENPDYLECLDILENRQVIGNETLHALWKLHIYSEKCCTKIINKVIQKRYLDLSETFFDFFMDIIYSVSQIDE